MIAGIPLTELFLVAVVGGLFGLLGSTVLSGTQIFKWQTGEKQKMAGDTAEQLAKAAGDLVIPLREEVRILREENETLKTMIADSEKKWNAKFKSIHLEYSQIQKELVIFKSWAERLVHQVYSLGAEPVPMLLEPAQTKNEEDEENGSNS